MNFINSIPLWIIVFVFFISLAVVCILGFNLVLTIRDRVSDRTIARRTVLHLNYSKATQAHLKWERDNPYGDDSDPEAQKLLRQRINAFGPMLKEYPCPEGELRLKEFTARLKILEKV